MRAVLERDEPVPFLDRQGQQLLVEARSNYRDMALAKTAVRESGCYVQILLWKGDRVHNTLTLLLQFRDIEALSHGLFVEVRGLGAAEVWHALRAIAAAGEISPLDIAAEVETKFRQKWDTLLPDDVLNADFAADMLDVPGTMLAIRRLLAVGDSEATN